MCDSAYNGYKVYCNDYDYKSIILQSSPYTKKFLDSYKFLRFTKHVMGGGFARTLSLETTIANHFYFRVRNIKVP